MANGGIFEVFSGRGSNAMHGHRGNDAGDEKMNEMGLVQRPPHIQSHGGLGAGEVEAMIQKHLHGAFESWNKQRADHARHEIVDSHFQQITPFVPSAVTAPAGAFGGQITSATGSLESVPQRDFQGERLVVDSLLGETGLPLWAIGNINIGADPQFTTPVGQAPSRGFDPLAVGVRLRMTLMRAQTQLSIPVILYNVNAGTPATYSDILSAMLIGPAVTPSLSR